MAETIVGLIIGVAIFAGITYGFQSCDKHLEASSEKRKSVLAECAKKGGVTIQTAQGEKCVKMQVIK